MSTSAQIAANKVNAKSSTGPRTAEGKARSAQNSLQHGLYSNRFLIRADEEIEFNEFYAAYVEDLQPRGAVEHTLFDELVHAAWNMRRIRRIETEFSGKSSDPLHTVENGERIDRLARHHSRNERTFHRCLREFSSQQTNRGLRDREVDHAPLESAPPLASIEKLTRRTQSPDPRHTVRRVLDLLMAELGGETARIVENFNTAGQGLCEGTMGEGRRGEGDSLTS